MEDHPRGIRWTLFSTLEDLDFVDDYFSSAFSHPQPHAREDQPFKQICSPGGLREVMTLDTSAHQGEWKRPPNDQTV